jgi:hypothetical protein
VPAQAWIDGGGYLRRMRISEPNYLGLGAAFTLQLDLTDIGTAFSIRLPPENAVADATNLF